MTSFKPYDDCADCDYFARIAEKPVRSIEEADRFAKNFNNTT
jgi:hypothetical protein